MTRSVEVEIEIDATIEDVYKALTEARELVRWFPLEAGHNDDGSVWMSWGGGLKFRVEVGASEPPHRARFHYRMPPPGADPSTLKPGDLVEIATDYTLSSKGGKTILRLVQSGFGEDSDWDDQFEGTRTGWAFQLRGLKHYLENHRGEDRIFAWARARYPGPRSDDWRTIMGEEGLGGEGRFVEGKPYAVECKTGDRLEGVVRFYEEPSLLVATVESLGNALLCVKLDELDGGHEANVMLSTYGLDRSEVEAFEHRWQERLDQLFSA